MRVELVLLSVLLDFLEGVMVWVVVLLVLGLMLRVCCWCCWSLSVVIVVSSLQSEGNVITDPGWSSDVSLGASQGQGYCSTGTPQADVTLTVITVETVRQMMNINWSFSTQQMFSWRQTSRWCEAQSNICKTKPNVYKHLVNITY